MSLPVRLATAVRHERVIEVRWGDGCPDHSDGEHMANKVLVDGSRAEALAVVWPDDPAAWPTRCSCGAEIDPAGFDDDGDIEAWRTMSLTPIYDVGELQPGDVYWVPCHGLENGGRCYTWDNCEGRHLWAVLPTGGMWSPDWKAGNCGSPDDRVHRCWVRHGEPPDIHVDKDGLTCAAGAGSIGADGWHGFLHHGQFVT